MNAMHTMSKRAHESEDEEDLELLRLEALKSLKKPTQIVVKEPSCTIVNPIPEAAASLCTNSAYVTQPKGCHKRGRYYGNGRIARNGSYINRGRNYNLISVPTVEPDAVPDTVYNRKLTAEQIPKLILPQDRYCGQKATSDEKTTEASSKFDRYNDSDNSGTDSESDNENLSETASPKKLERTSSLEALLQELDNEIRGDTKPLPETIKPKNKLKKLKLTQESDLVNSETPDDLSEIGNVEVKPTVMEMKPYEHKPQIEDENQESFVSLKKQESFIPNVTNPTITKTAFVPLAVQSNIVQTNPLPTMPFVNAPMPAVSTAVPYTPVYPNLPVPVVYNSTLPYPFPNLTPSVTEPIRTNRPVSPLSINTDILNTITAPLSPRSAAFVLQNREIIERRKKSPRRSYSRSPSPEYRRSPSPRYRRSPKRSPRLSPVRRISPARTITRRISPKLKSNSRHCSPKPVTASPRRHIKHRSDVKASVSIKSEEEIVTSIQNRSVALCRSPSSELTSRSNSPVDAILEARRKKFETGNTIATEGVIRLKPKVVEEEDINDNKEMEETQEELNEDDLLVGEELDLGVMVTSNNIFSDEESDSDNEGRFKSSQQETNRVSVVPFTQLLNETSKMIRNENFNGSKLPYEARSSARATSSYSRNKDRTQRSYSPSELENSKTTSASTTNLERRPSKYSLKLKMDSKGHRRRPPIVSPIESKKIEIRIRNPSKYESTSTNSKDDGTENVRKVEVSLTNVVSKEEDNDKETKMFSESDEDSKNGGDLRTQLSRKRAERQNKLPTVDGVQSRLLQNALQGAIYKKVKKNEKEKASSDGKLPIHLRLGIPGSMDIFSDTPIQKTCRKRSKNRGNLDQV